MTACDTEYGFGVAIGLHPHTALRRPLHVCVIDEADQEKMGVNAVAAQEPKMGDTIGQLIIAGRPGPRVANSKVVTDQLESALDPTLRCRSGSTGRNHFTKMGLGFDQDDLVTGETKSVPLRSPCGPKCRQRVLDMIESQPAQKTRIAVFGEIVVRQWRSPGYLSQNGVGKQVRTAIDAALEPFQAAA